MKHSVCLFCPLRKYAWKPRHITRLSIGLSILCCILSCSAPLLPQPEGVEPDEPQNGVTTGIQISIVGIPRATAPEAGFRQEDQPGTSTGPDQASRCAASRQGSDYLPAILQSELSASLANVYEVLVLKSDEIAAKLVLTPGQTQSIALPPGLYKLGVLAGFRKSSTSQTTILLGSAWAASAVEVTEGHRTPVSMQILPIDFGFDLASSWALGTEFSINLVLDSQNAHISALEGGTTSERPRVKSVEVFGGYQDFSQLTRIGGKLNGKLTCPTAPSSSGTVSFEFYGGYAALNGLGMLDGSLYGRTNLIWKWPNRGDIGDESPLLSLVKREVNLTGPATGLDVSIGW